MGIQSSLFSGTRNELDNFACSLSSLYAKHFKHGCIRDDSWLSVLVGCCDAPLAFSGTFIWLDHQCIKFNNDSLRGVRLCSFSENGLAHEHI